MGKSSRTKARDTTAAAGEVGPRQPCPCGSGRRYKACHGAADGAPALFVNRPFQAMPSECDVVALRELVPAATAPLTLADGVGDGRPVQLCSLLPMAAPAMVRDSGQIWLGLQVQHNFGDPARDLAAALEQANAAANPTARLTQVEAAYWTDVGTKEHLRWVMPHDEDSLLTALARLHAAGRDQLAEGCRLVGMFRAHGLLVPVWDLPVGTGPEALEDAAAEFADAVVDALGSGTPLTTEERAARAGLANRQVTLR
jgi:hypothetical protein